MFKDILVHVDDSNQSAARVDIAVNLARSFNAHLTGIVIAIDPPIPIAAPGMMPLDAFAEERTAIQQRAAETATRFRANLERAGMTPDCRVANAPMSDAPFVLSLHARHADLVVLGQIDDGSPLAQRSIPPQDVAMACGRPALVVPYIGAPARPAERVLVAWNSSRESARAVNDALPFLRRAGLVTILSVNPESDLPGERRLAGADIALHLARHGVKAETQQTVTSEISVGDAILGEVADGGHDFLVMGCYGHSRLRETILGGATRHMLEHMTVPVLMCH